MPVRMTAVMSEVDSQTLYIHRKHVGLKHIYSEAPGMLVVSACLSGLATALLVCHRCHEFQSEEFCKRAITLY